MADRFESERAAWIKGRHWWNGPAAARRAESLSRTARKRERCEAGLDSSNLGEARTKGALAQWTTFDDATTSGLGFVAFLIVHVIYVPIALGIAWLVGRAAFGLAQEVSSRVKVLPFVAIAAVWGVLAVLARAVGWDVPVIYALAGWIETLSGGLIAPIALSGWYAAGLLSWAEIQVVLGLLYAVYLTAAWGWLAPAVRRGRTDGRVTTDKGVKVIGPEDTAEQVEESTEDVRVIDSLPDEEQATEPPADVEEPVENEEAAEEVDDVPSSEDEYISEDEVDVDDQVDEQIEDLRFIGR